MDWATAAIEAVGLLILGIWIVIPIREFQGIFARIRQKDHTGHDVPAQSEHEVGGGPPAS